MAEIINIMGEQMIIPSWSQAINYKNGSFKVTSSKSLKKAQLDVLRFAREDGYKLPKWWQFWNKDTDVRKWRK